MPELYRFAVVDGSDIDQLVATLGQRLRLRRDSTERVTRLLLDTFDWRLHRHGSRLEVRGARSGPAELVWRDARSGEVLGRTQIQAPPRFVWDLPPGPMAERLSEVLEMRALTELVTIDSSLTSLRLLDAESKTTARVTVDESRWRGRALSTVLEVLPVRGYERAAEELADQFAAQVVLDPTDADPLDAAVRLAGFVPGSYSSKLRLDLDPEATAIDAWVEVLRALLATMVVNEAGVREDLDSEFLHDYRVAVRRTRSILSQGRGVIGTGILERFRPEFAWLGAVTSPTRDFDVYLLAIPQFTAQLPEDRRADLEPFSAFLAAEQQAAHTELSCALTSQRYSALLDAWREWLADPRVVDGGVGERSDEPAPVVAAERIWRAYRRLSRDGGRIHGSSAPEDLHELRKDAKRLRYLLECFGSLFPAERVSPIVKELKGLQDVLGEFQDCEVEAASLDEFAARMLDAGDAPPATLLAMGYVMEALDARRDVARSEYDERFAHFDAKALRRAARDLFGPRARAAEEVFDG